MKKIAILGSTGSIGKQALDIISRFPEEFKVTVLAAGGKSLDAFEKQIREYKPALVAVYDENAAGELRNRIADLSIEVLSGLEGVEKAAAYEDSDIVLTSLVGAIGILPTLAAIKKGKTIALANKETLVAAGQVVMQAAKENNVAILPVDSEHSAIFQSLHSGNRSELKKILLTASGGPFFTWEKEKMIDIKPAQALKHPNWSMGGKITIDSATMMNKGLEVIEAKWLFDVTPEQIQVIVHPESIIHSMVEFQDTTVIGQMGLPDMRVPIQYAFTYPERWANGFDSLDLFKLQKLTFIEPDFERFPCLKYAYQALKAGGTMTAVMNAANEIAVYAFLKEQIGFLDIGQITLEVMEMHNNIGNPDMEAILEMDKWAREQAKMIIQKRLTK